MTLRPSAYRTLDPLFTDSTADDLMRLCERFGSYGMYAQQPIQEGLGAGLFQRHDAVINFISTGGRFGRREDYETLGIRTNYFRETYWYGRPKVDGIEAFLHHEGFRAGAREIYDRPVVCPSIVYANILVPGQELSVHTDVPEFRGMNRTREPEFLLVAMHHSGLFNRWRMPIATAVSWYGRPEGGEFAYYPDGPDAPARTIPAAHNTAVVMDTDSTFHGVDRVVQNTASLPPIEQGMRLRHVGDGRWTVGFPDATPVAEYTWDDLRFSVSWKAYCYADEAERRMVEEHADDLTHESVIETLVADLRARGRLGDTLPNPTDLALLLIEEYIRYPAPISEPSSA